MVGSTVVFMTGVISSPGSAGGAGELDGGFDAARLATRFATRLATVDTTRLNDHDLLDHIADLERLAAWVAERQHTAMADFGRRPARVESSNNGVNTADELAPASATWAPIGTCVREFAADEIAARLHISGRDAVARIGTGALLASLPLTRAALSEGRIDLRRARVITDGTAALTPDVARGVEAAVIDRAQHLPAARLKPLVARAAIACDPAAAAAREQRARAERRVVITPVSDGMAELWALLPATDALTIKTAITAAARADKARAVKDRAVKDRAEKAGAGLGRHSDDRTMDQRIADALVAPFAHTLATGELVGTGLRLAEHRGKAAELHVTVSAETLMGISDAPADLAGYGPISAGAARALAPDARWRRVLTNPVDGTVLDVSRDTYRPTADMTRHTETAAQRCSFPGCGWNAEACDLDHIVPFPHGPTTPTNLTPLCRRHHRLKSSPGVTVKRTPKGRLRWLFPSGHESTTDPPGLGPTYEQPPPA